MPRKRRYPPLRVLLNGRMVGQLWKELGGAIGFRYDESWLADGRSIPVSLSLPLREDAYRGQAVSAVFDNLLPDSEVLRRRVAERVGAAGVDSFSLLSEIGQDCVGALQFLPEDVEVASADSISGEPVDDLAIERLLNNLGPAPLGLDREREFRISVAGAHEKTALLWHEGRWFKPHGMTPTTHIFKTRIGMLPGGIDLSASIENEFYCLKLLSFFGLRSCAAEIRRFGDISALVVERFDRFRTAEGKLVRLHQEDCCQALSVSPWRKYQSDGGPGILEILDLLKGADSPAEDQKAFLKAQIIFWLIGATDGHAKNFSVLLGAGGQFRLAPFYDVLTAQPSVEAKQIHHTELKLAMFVGKNRHYVIDRISGRHFIQSAERAGVPAVIVREALDEVSAAAPSAFAQVEGCLDSVVLEQIHEAVKSASTRRVEHASAGAKGGE